MHDYWGAELVNAADLRAAAPAKDGILIVGAWMSAPPLGRDSLLSLLSEGECRRVERLKVSEARERLILSRGLARLVLREAFDVDMAGTEFAQTPAGKPFVGKQTDARQPPLFNISHSGDAVIAAFTNLCDVGLDIECMRSVRDAGRIARGYFAEGEARAVADASDEERMEVFHRIWTRKEACIKALGDGRLMSHLRSVDVSGLPHGGGWVGVVREGEADKCFLVRDLSAPRGHVAAIALSREPSDFGMVWLTGQ